MISALLIPKLHRRFPGRGLRTDPPPAPCAVFPATHPDVGDVQIYDDGDEVMLGIGTITHGHFSNHDDTLSPEQKAATIADEVADFLEALFADQIVLWGSAGRSGGWYHLVDDATAFWADDEKKHLWSGPLPPQTKSDATP